MSRRVTRDRVFSKIEVDMPSHDAEVDTLNPPSNKHLSRLEPARLPSSAAPEEPDPPPAR